MGENKTIHGGGGGQISTGKIPITGPGVSCAKIGVQTVRNEYQITIL